MRMRTVRPRGQIGRVRVFLGSCGAEGTSEGGERRMGMGGVAFSTTLWHDGRNNSAEVPAGGQHLQKKGGSAGKVVVRGPKGINALSLVRLGNHIDALVTGHRKCINSFRFSRHRRLRGAMLTGTGPTPLQIASGHF